MSRWRAQSGRLGDPATSKMTSARVLEGIDVLPAGSTGGGEAPRELGQWDHDSGRDLEPTGPGPVVIGAGSGHPRLWFATMSP